MIALNPELQRYLWLELSPRRLIIVPVILGVLMSPWLIAKQSDGSVSDVATWLYYALVVVWGTRMAANAVIGEIRGGTWHLQRLSSQSPWAMLWGKLIGAPILVWYAGAICLVPIVTTTFIKQGPAEAIVDLLYFVTVGLFAHSVSLLTSLLSVRKRALKQSWLDSFLFQACGIAAGATAASLWNAARKADALKAIEWYGASFPSARFTLASLVVFFLWSIIGNWRLLRRELQVRNGPLVWIALLVFMMAYYAGFADVVSQPEWRHAIRLAAAGSVAAVLAYVMMFIEPKDAVHIRWLVDQFTQGRVDRWFNGLQSWMIAYAAAVFVALWLVFTLNVPSPRAVLDEFEAFGWFDWTAGDAPILPWRLLIIAALLFMTRDMALFLTFNFAKRARRADFLAILWLAILYFILPGLLGGISAGVVLPMFVPAPATPPWLGPVFPAVEAAILISIAARRLFALDRKSPTG